MSSRWLLICLSVLMGGCGFGGEPCNKVERRCSGTTIWSCDAYRDYDDHLHYGVNTIDCSEQGATCRNGICAYPDLACTPNQGYCLGQQEIWCDNSGLAHPGRLCPQDFPCQEFTEEVGGKLVKKTSCYDSSIDCPENALSFCVKGSQVVTCSHGHPSSFSFDCGEFEDVPYCYNLYLPTSDYVVARCTDVRDPCSGVDSICTGVHVAKCLPDGMAEATDIKCSAQ